MTSAAERREQKRVAVGRGPRDCLRADEVCRPRPVVDDELLPQGARELLGDDPAEDVGTVPRRLWYDNHHRALRPGLGSAPAARWKEPRQPATCVEDIVVMFILPGIVGGGPLFSGADAILNYSR